MLKVLLGFWLGLATAGIALAEYGHGGGSVTKKFPCPPRGTITLTIEGSGGGPADSSGGKSGSQ